MSLANIAAEIFMKQIGGSGNADMISAALGSLLGGSDGNIDLMDIISKFQSGGLENVVSSWLGDGGNDGISAEQITNILGLENIVSFAAKIGIDTDTALGGLQNTIPNMIDHSSSNGSLLDSVGGIDGALNIAKGLFG